MKPSKIEHNCRVARQLPELESTKFRPYTVDNATFSRFALAEPAWTEYSTEEAIRTAYHKSFYFNTCVDAIAEAVSSVRLLVFERNSDDTWEPSPRHPLQYLLDFPNPYITRRQLLERLAGHVMLSGNALWSKVRYKNDIIELWPLDPDKTIVYPSKTKFIDRYEYGVDPQHRKVLKAEDITHFTRINYSNLYWGEGHVKVGQRLINFDSETLDWNMSIIQNQGIIPAILGVKHRLTKEQVQELREDIRRRRMDGDRAGEDLIIGSDISYERVGSTSEEMKWLESRKLTRQDIAMMMRVPLPMVSIYDDATLANIEQARKIFWQDRIIPFLRNIEDSINLSITPEFGDRNDIYVEADYSDIQAVKQNRFETAKVANILVRLGWAPRAVNRELQMGFRDDDITEGFLVQQISSIGTAAGTREMTSGESEKPLTKSLTPDDVLQAAKWRNRLIGLFEAERKTIIDQLISGPAVLPSLSDSISLWIEFYKDEPEKAQRELEKSAVILYRLLKKVAVKNPELAIAATEYVYDDWIESRVDELIREKLDVSNPTLHSG